MDIEIFRSIMTVVSMGTFLGIVGWAWGSGRRQRFDAAARLPLEDDAYEAGLPVASGRNREGEK